MLRVWREGETQCTVVKNTTGVHQKKSERKLFYDVVVLLLDMDPKEVKSKSQKDPYIPVFISAFIHSSQDDSNLRGIGKKIQLSECVGVHISILLSPKTKGNCTMNEPATCYAK